MHADAPITLRNRHTGGTEVERVFGEDLFKVRAGRGIEMDPAPIKAEADRRLAHAPGQDRAQEGILDPQKVGTGPVGHLAATRACRALAPDADEIAFAWFAQRYVISGQRQDAPHALFGQKATAENIKPPQGRCGGFVILCRCVSHRRRGCQAR